MEKIQESTESYHPLWHKIINPLTKALVSVADTKLTNKLFIISWGYYDKNEFSTIVQIGNSINESVESDITINTY